MDMPTPILCLGSDAGVHEASSKAGRHVSPVRYGPEARTAVPDLSASINKYLCKNIYIYI